MPEARPITPEHICQLISGYRFGFDDEAQLQRGIASVFHMAGIEHMREFCLSPQDRPDFFVGRGDNEQPLEIVVEVKVKGSKADVLRQLHRYAQHDQVSAIVLVTTRAIHTQMPPTLNGKPVHVASLLNTAF